MKPFNIYIAQLFELIKIGIEDPLDSFIPFLITVFSSNTQFKWERNNYFTYLRALSPTVMFIQQETFIEENMKH